jgi:hydrogenase maturation protease
LQNGVPDDASRLRPPWRVAFKQFLVGVPCELFGIGNPIKGDDSAGLYIIKQLRRMNGKRPRKNIIIHGAITAPEITPPRSFFKESRIIIFDSAELNLKPGSIALANISDTRYGFFSTHNIPLKLVSSFSSNPSRVWILGIQPEDVSVSERLSDTVRQSADEVITFVGEILRGEEE